MSPELQRLRQQDGLFSIREETDLKSAVITSFDKFIIEAVLHAAAHFFTLRKFQARLMIYFLVQEQNFTPRTKQGHRRDVKAPL